MSYIRHIATSRAGPETHVTGITDLTLMGTGSALRIYSASGRDGGVLARDAGLRVTSEASYAPTAGLGAEARLQAVSLGGRDALLVSGPAQAGISGFWLGQNGAITGRFDLAGPRVEAMTALEVVRLGGQDYFFSAARDTPGISGWRQGADGRLQQTQQITVALQAGGNDIFALEHVRIGSGDFILALSARGNGLHNFRLAADGSARLVDMLDTSEGLGISMATQLTQVQVAGQTFLLMGAAGSSSISVIRVSADGTLRVTDQVNDDRDTRFQSISVLESIVVDGKAYVVAGGADDGLTLMTLLPDGRLLHLQTIPDDLVTALSNPSSVALSAQGSMISLYTAGLTGDAYGASGVGRFEINPNAGGTAGQVMLGGAGDDQLTGTAGADQILGGAGNDQLRGGDGADVLVDGAGADQMWGGAGADVFVLVRDGQTDTIRDFELGIDRIDISQMGRFYTVEALGFESRGDGARLSIGGETLVIRTADGSRLRAEDFDRTDLTDLWHVATDQLPKGDQLLLGTALDDMILGAEGADTISGGAGSDTLEGGSGRDMLLGGGFDAVFDPAAATVYRLYRATLDRAPDTAGHLGWTAALTGGGRPLDAVARGFVNSLEFQKTYGNTTDQAFMTLLYNNVLDRAPDAGGLRGWTDRLATGTSREQVVTGFSESREFRIDTAAEAVTLSREAYQVEWFDDVYRLYAATLDRAPDTAGIEGWTAALAQGAPIQQVAAGFSGSREFQATYGSLDDRAFVTLLYNNVLDRAPDAAGLRGWTDRLAAGTDRGMVVTGFSQSREFTAITAPQMAAWIASRGTDDELHGSAGTNVMFGGMWSDTFVFDVAKGGRHEVADLEPWDQLSFRGFGFQNADDVRAHITRDGDDAVFSHAGVVVRLVDVDMAQLDSDGLFDF
jgi:Ca2+-binding RTX toxin-like protein